MTRGQHIDKIHALVAFGANLPALSRPPAETIRTALAELVKSGHGLAAVSRFYATPCFPAGAGPDYVNAAAALRVSADVTPRMLLDDLHRIEAAMGRTRGRRWAGRTLDIDLLAWGDSVLPDAATQDAWRLLPPDEQARRAPDRLILPHPRLQDRAFVLVPLADVAADWVHPRLHRSVAEMLAARPEDERDAVKPL
jgi:2-amino-4-hydroxy-6-hydroxymethyldihydropteridine diphosphokinase